MKRKKMFLFITSIISTFVSAQVLKFVSILTRNTCVLTTIELNCEKIFVFVFFIVTSHLLNILVTYFFFWIVWKYFERVFNIGRTRFAGLNFKAQRKYFNFSYFIEQQQYRWFIQWESKHVRGWWRRRRWWRSLPSTRKVTNI